MSLPNWRSALSAMFDALYSEHRQKQLDRWVVNVSVAGFFTHLALVFLARTLASPPPLIAAVGTNYLSAIYTPFSFILFYEVLLLIGALPESTTQSLAKQYEIVSLIFVRSFFKSIAELHGIGRLESLAPDALPALMNVSAGLFMFLLVTIFLHLASRGQMQIEGAGDRGQMEVFISRKKVIALALAVLLMGFAVWRVIEYVTEAFEVIYHAAPRKLDVNAFFYTDVFAVMIFTDVLIVILSLMVADRYELVFRNAAFVISTILIRFSLTANWPYGAILALMGMVFGICTLLIYNYQLRINGRRIDDWRI